VTDLADETNEQLASLVVTDDEPVVLSPNKEAAAIEECEYCGHAPCGCGG
jgi:hypothetical protein